MDLFVLNIFLISLNLAKISQRKVSKINRSDDLHEQKFAAHYVICASVL